MAQEIELKNITKRFGKVMANHQISLAINQGEILALLGENGSGKTTLMNMLSGLYYPDEGTISVEGKDVKITSPKKAFDLGIGMVHQHFKLIDTFTAGENIILGLDGGFWLKMKDVNAKITALCDRYSFQINLNKKVYDMNNIIAWIAYSVVYASVIMMGALGETLTEKSGHLNLGVPGIMV